MTQQYSNVPEVLGDDFEPYPQIDEVLGDGIPEVLDGEPVLDMEGDFDGPIEVLAEADGPAEVLADGCPDNLDESECEEWETNTEKYQDKFKTADQVRRASGQWIIQKKTRSRANPTKLNAYSNPDTCAQAGVTPGRVYTDKKKAEADAKKLSKANPVGFEVTQLGTEVLATYEPGAKDYDGSGYTPGATIEDPEATESAEGSDIPDGDGNTEKRAASDVIESLWALVTEMGYMLGAVEDYRDAASKSYWRHSVSDEQLNGAMVYELVNVPEQVAARFVDVGTPAQMFQDGYAAWREAKKYAKGLRKKLASVDLESLWGPVGKEAASPSGLYGFTRGVQSDCEACTRKIAKAASRLAKAAYQKDPKTADFLGAHAKRGHSLTARVLVGALRDMAPKVGSVDKEAGTFYGWEYLKRRAKIDGVMQGFLGFTDQEWAKIQAETKRLIQVAESKGIQLAGPHGSGRPEIEEGYIMLNGSRAKGEDYESFRLTRRASSFQTRGWTKTKGFPYSDVVESILGAVVLIAPKALKMDSPPHRLLASQEEGFDKEAKARPKGLYGFGAKTASLGLSTCTALRDEVGRMAYDLHSRKANRHEHITGFLNAHIKEAGCDHSRLLASCYPDADCKVASTETVPSTVAEWLAHD